MKISPEDRSRHEERVAAFLNRNIEPDMVDRISKLLISEKLLLALGMVYLMVADIRHPNVSNNRQALAPQLPGLIRMTANQIYIEEHP